MQRKSKIIIGIVLVLYIIGIILYHYVGQEKEISERDNQNETVIVTSFYPMYLHVTALTEGTNVKVVNLTDKQVGCLHDYQLTVGDMQKISDADILVINGLGNENFMDKAYEQNKALKIINASSVIEEVLEENEHQEDDMHGHEETEGHEAHRHHVEDKHHGHNHAFNEHIWVSLEGSMTQIKTISEALQEIDPVNATIYAKNEKNYMNKMIMLKEEMLREIKPIKGKALVSTHSTFEYFVKEFGLEIAAVILQNEESVPTPKQIEEIVKIMEDKDIHIIFTEKQYEYLGIVKTIARETDSEIYYLDSFVTQEPESSDEEYPYIRRMRQNMEVLQEAYGL